jgi:hypothetical protein
MKTLALESRYRVFLYTGTLLSIPVKLFYSLSRPLFESGPDAPTYIPSAIDFAKSGFFQKGIEGMPNWPAGYPWLQSFLVRLSDSHWKELAQISQVLLFSISIILFYRFISHIITPKVGFYSSLILLISPAWAVANGESMYETYLFSFLVYGTFLLFVKGSEPWLKYSSAFFFGMAIIIHPRIIPIVIIIIFYGWTQFKTIKFGVFVYASILVFLPIMFSVRNLVAEGIFTLSDALVPSLSYHTKSFANCQSLSCVPSSILQHPIDFIGECLFNFYAFWSPHSGALSKGSWFHNISLLTAFDLKGFVIFGQILSLLIVILGILFVVLGIIEIKRSANTFSNLLIFLLATFLLTDFLIFGDNRHRLVGLFCIAPLQVLGIFRLKENVLSLQKSSNNYQS